MDLFTAILRAELLRALEPILGPTETFLIERDRIRRRHARREHEARMQPIKVARARARGEVALSAAEYEAIKAKQTCGPANL